MKQTLLSVMFLWVAGTNSAFADLSDVDLSGTWNLPEYGNVFLQLDSDVPTETLESDDGIVASYTFPHKTYTGEFTGDDGQKKLATVTVSSPFGDSLEFMITVMNKFQSKAALRAEIKAAEEGSNPVPEGYNSTYYRIASYSPTQVKLNPMIVVESVSAADADGFSEPDAVEVDRSVVIEVNKIQ